MILACVLIETDLQDVVESNVLLTISGKFRNLENVVWKNLKIGY